MKPGQSTILAIVGLGAVVLSACGSGAASGLEAAATETVPLAVTVATTERGDIHASYPAASALSADSEAVVTARAGGEVLEILVEEGDSVAAGQILARLDGARLRLQMLRAQAEFEKARNEHDRQRGLHERGLVGSAALDELKFRLDALRAAFELARLEHGYAHIRAPIAGVISARDVKLGQHVDAGSPVFRITDSRKLVAYLLIPQAELSRFSVGDAALLRVDALPGRTFTATIVRISPTIDSRTGTFKATVEFDNGSRELAPGMFARFAINYATHSNALLVPAGAIIEEDGETVVYVVSDGFAERRVVRTGIRSNGRIEVLDGLEDDERIVIAGRAGLGDGARISARADSEAVVTGG